MPTPRQAEFLSASEEEVLYGGAAGGGKTDALVVDALGVSQRALLQPDYRALLLRRTYDELREVVDRQRALYPQVMPGAEYRAGDRLWQFPSGARIELGYLDRDDDVYRYQSRQFQWIGWEELAQWPTARPYEYLQSRLRAPTGLPLTCYTRATCNPDGPGARWIAARWGIQPDGGPARQTGRRFIPARLADNPYLGSEYRRRLESLDSWTRAALLDGRWDEPSVEGSIYEAQLKEARAEGHITAVPWDPTLRVDTTWDLGIGDATAIWFSQSVGREVRLIDYYEACGEGLPHYAAVLETKPYLYGRHIAPHDIQVRELGSGRSRIETAQSLGIRFEVAPQIGLEDGIHATRMLFPRLWFDRDKCRVGLEALGKYRRTYNSRLGEFSSTPVHDWSSHGADALRYLAVSHRDVQVEKRRAYEPRYVSFEEGGGQGWMSM